VKKSLIWTLTIVITLATAVYQRMTGPTYPMRGKALVGDEEVAFKFLRSQETTDDCEVGVTVKNPDISGILEYKRYKTTDGWTRLPMERKDGRLVSFLPKQPPAGKLAYRVLLSRQGQEVSLTREKPIIIRFKGTVSALILIPHVIIMFLAMLLSTRAGMAALDRKANPRRFALWTAVLLFVGGFILGPIVQKLSFGAWWTGFPLGFDLTDNKTLIALIGWIAALIAGRGGKPARGWVLGAAILMLIIFMIPHSLFGSELDYSRMIP
jgi:hypothetical protein